MTNGEAPNLAKFSASAIHFIRAAQQAHAHLSAMADRTASIFMGAVFLITIAVAGCGPTETPSPQAKIERQSSQAVDYPEPSDERVDRSHAGMPAPDALFQDPAGEAASIPQFAGKAVLLNLWATWCAPCVAEMPALDDLAAREKNIIVLAVSQDLDGQEDVQAFFADRDFRRLQPNIDPELTLMRRLGINTLPTTILYDASGREIWRMKGMADWQGPSAARLISEANMLVPTSRERNLGQDASKRRLEEL